MQSLWSCTFPSHMHEAAAGRSSGVHVHALLSPRCKKILSFKSLLLAIGNYLRICGGSWCSSGTKEGRIYKLHLVPAYSKKGYLQITAVVACCDNRRSGGRILPMTSQCHDIPGNTCNLLSSLHVQYKYSVHGIAYAALPESFHIQSETVFWHGINSNRNNTEYARY